MSAGRARLVVIVGDQIIASACAYVLVLLVARAASPSTFGYFVIAFGVVALTTAVGRASFGVVLGMAGGAPTHDQATLERRSTAALVILGVAVAGVLAAAALAVGGPATSILLVLAVAVPALLVQDLVRYAVVARGRPRVALVADVIWLTPTLALLTSDLVRGESASAIVSGLVWLAGLAVSLCWLAVGSHLRSPSFDGLAPWLRSDVRRLHLGTDAVLSGLAPVGNGLGAAAVSGADATAAVRGGSALFAPLATLLQAMALGAVPEAKRRPVREARRLLVFLTCLLLAAAVCWGAAMVVLPDSVGTEVLGETWPSAEPLLPYFAVEYLGLALWSGGASMLRYANATRDLLRVRLAYAPTALLLPVFALSVTDDVRAFAVTLAILGSVVGLAAMALGWRSINALIVKTSPPA